MAITVLRQYFAYDLLDSRTFSVTLDITMKITEKQPFLLLPIKGYVADLKITDSEGKNMIILSDHEFEEQFGLSMDKIKEQYLERLNKNPSNRIKQITKKYRVIAILFNDKISNEYYEKIKIQWKDEAVIKNNGWISKYSEIPIYLPRYGFKQNSASAIYLSIRTDTKHKIIEKPVISNWKKKKKLEFVTILNSVNHKIYRFKETEKPQLIQINVKMGLPNTVTKWAKLGLVSAIVVPISLVLFTLITGKIPSSTFELMAGVIALLIGERVLIFRDIPLMKKWSSIHLCLAIWCIIILISLMFIPDIIKLTNV